MNNPASDHPLEALDLVDFKRAAARLGGDMDDYLAVAEVFLDDVAAVRARLAAADRSQLVAVSHELANSFGVVGAERAERLARAVERGLRAGENLDLVGNAAILMRELDGVDCKVRCFVSRARADAGSPAQEGGCSGA